jgi:hypothetical protein
MSRDTCQLCRETRHCTCHSVMSQDIGIGPNPRLGFGLFLWAAAGHAAASPSLGTRPTYDNTEQSHCGPADLVERAGSVRRAVVARVGAGCAWGVAIRSGVGCSGG